MNARRNNITNQPIDKNAAAKIRFTLPSQMLNQNQALSRGTGLFQNMIPKRNFNSKIDSWLENMLSKLP